MRKNVTNPLKRKREEALNNVVHYHFDSPLIIACDLISRKVRESWKLIEEAILILLNCRNTKWRTDLKNISLDNFEVEKDILMFFPSTCSCQEVSSALHFLMFEGRAAEIICYLEECLRRYCNEVISPIFNDIMTQTCHSMIVDSDDDPVLLYIFLVVLSEWKNYDSALHQIQILLSLLDRVYISETGGNISLMEIGYRVFGNFISNKIEMVKLNFKVFYRCIQNDLKSLKRMIIHINDSTSLNSILPNTSKLKFFMDMYHKCKPFATENFVCAGSGTLDFHIATVDVLLQELSDKLDSSHFRILEYWIKIDELYYQSFMDITECQKLCDESQKKLIHMTILPLFANTINEMLSQAKFDQFLSAWKILSPSHIGSQDTLENIMRTAIIEFVRSKMSDIAVDKKHIMYVISDIILLKSTLIKICCSNGTLIGNFWKSIIQSSLWKAIQVNPQIIGEGCGTLVNSLLSISIDELKVSSHNILQKTQKCGVSSEQLVNTVLKYVNLLPFPESDKVTSNHDAQKLLTNDSFFEHSLRYTLIEYLDFLSITGVIDIFIASYKVSYGTRLLLDVRPQPSFEKIVQEWLIKSSGSCNAFQEQLDQMTQDICDAKTILESFWTYKQVEEISKNASFSELHTSFSMRPLVISSETWSMLKQIPLKLPKELNNQKREFEEFYVKHATSSDSTGKLTGDSSKKRVLKWLFGYDTVKIQLYESSFETPPWPIIQISLLQYLILEAVSERDESEEMSSPCILLDYHTIRASIFDDSFFVESDESRKESLFEQIDKSTAVLCSFVCPILTLFLHESPLANHQERLFCEKDVIPPRLESITVSKAEQCLREGCWMKLSLRKAMTVLRSRPTDSMGVHVIPRVLETSIFLEDTQDNFKFPVPLTESSRRDVLPCIVMRMVKDKGTVSISEITADVLKRGFHFPTRIIMAEIEKLMERGYLSRESKYQDVFSYLQ